MQKVANKSQFTSGKCITKFFFSILTKGRRASKINTQKNLLIRPKNFNKWSGIYNIIYILFTILVYSKR